MPDNQEIYALAKKLFAFSADFAGILWFNGSSREDTYW